ncbi:MAG: FAD-dependent oxidoreductase, partial [Cellvibrionaceae bacterium]|nr:FAD-dependent oxidoreductase [Cellvibrionaceae bacterium]
FDGRKIIERRDWAEGEPRYVARGAMNGLAKTVAEGLDIRRQVQITELRHNGKWQLLDAEGRHYRDYDWVVCTAPAPQARALLPRQFKHHSALEQTPMAGCYALMLGFEQPLALDFEAAHIRNSALAWLAVNSHKPGRQGGFSLVLHSSAEYAEANLDTEREQVLQQLRDCGSELLGHPLDPADCQMLHLWRYANNQCRNPQPPLVDADMQLAATGDWICGGRVEGAFNGAEQMLAALEPLL